MRLPAALKWRLDVYNRKKMRSKWEKHLKKNHKDRVPVDKITLVVVGRNDNYGGDFSHRLKSTLDWNLSQLPNPELIYVEWNQIPERESDCGWIIERYDNARCFVVSKEIHESLNTNKKLPMLEYHAKNMGIRHASNEWIMVINADCFVDKNVIETLKKGVNKNCFYGTHYNNIKWDDQTIEDRHLTDQSIRLHMFSADFELRAVVGNLVMAHRDAWEKITGYNETLTNQRIGCDDLGRRQFIHFGYQPMLLGDHFHLDHNESSLYGSNSTHGDLTSDDLATMVPYSNEKDWGFKYAQTNQVQQNVYQLDESAVGR